ncbi:MAG: hypothetical protein A3J66_04130 [Candidatus Magasanikbacteria bacterium RIFCSPHIGHO2_02_FULL_47_14]|uniref:Cyclic nucleotide-binding protein n=1 Tax=Candidatus Magasanikbacteria bacterium RIFCSPHIGHO2_02_FULL_47_14 TaxID=1798680 RepID=A0A1F6M3S9_9BACT|nr:MAG: hypothetical protein A3J66_04130 [Candidatus Magasanikbacteria bacterium RIFCSPHIGHO2_02_FULL_47_14]
MNEHPIINHKKDLSRGQRAADRMTAFLGSWAFILLFIFFLVIWMIINILAAMYRWDPYPFILLNLVLSCIAAIQGPVIMMSQNRHTDRDRVAAKYDYAVNRKAEKEIQLIQKELHIIKQLLDTSSRKKTTKKHI